MAKLLKILHIERAMILALGALFSVTVMAQNSASSPYSLYGHGELNDNAPNTYRAMGGVGIGMRNHKVINPMQPASYTACDSLTFMMDVAATISWSRYQDASGMRNRANGNLENLTIQLPLYKRYVAVSLGILPFAASGYSFSLADTTSSVGTIYPNVKTYDGSGSISQLYGGISFNVMDWLAVGANFYYLFGTSSKNSMLTFTDPSVTNTLVGEYFKARSFRYRVGAQLFHEFENHAFTIGATFESKMPLTADYFVYESATADSAYYTDEHMFDLPLSYGVGASYTWHNRLTVAADYTCQRWSNALYRAETNQFRDRHHVAVGVEYRNNPYSRKYVDQMLWRGGFNYGTSYIPNVTGPEFTITAGFGFPLRASGTQINATVEYSHRGPRAAASPYLSSFRKADGMQDNTLRLIVNVSVCENWFFKRKI